MSGPMGGVRILPCGPQAILAELDSLDAVMGAAAQLRAAGLAEVTEIVPAARTLLVQHAGADTAGIERVLRSTVPWTAAAVPPVEIPVRYDGVDLSEVARTVGLTIDELIELHSGTAYVGAFCGFMPGFTYLVGLDPRLHLPRRATPRPRVPSGSVAIGSEFTGVYPCVSPGGWHLLGSTDATMWDDARAEPALIAPGANVRFVPQ